MLVNAKQSLPQCRPLQHSARSSRQRLVVRSSGSTYGTCFRVTTFGESHGKGVGCVVDGVPPRLPISQEEIQLELDRRRPGQSIITTPRKEEDTCEILSGVFDGITLGTPIAVLVKNKDQRSADYSEMSVAYRPSHADATYDFKYGIRAIAGGGRSSARETIGRVAAGAIAKKLLHVVAGTEVRCCSSVEPHDPMLFWWLVWCCPLICFGIVTRWQLPISTIAYNGVALKYGRGTNGSPVMLTDHFVIENCALLQVLAYVSRVMDIDSHVDQATFTMEDVESNIVRCPDQAAAQKMIDGAHS